MEVTTLVRTVGLAQKRFKHLKAEDYERIRGYRDAEWDRLRRLASM